MHHHFFRTLFLLSLLVLAYALGAGMMALELPPTASLRAVKEAYETYKTSTKAADFLTPQGVDVRSVFAHATSNHTAAGYQLVVIRYQSSAQLLDKDGHITHEWHMPYSKAFPAQRNRRKAAEQNIYFEKAVVFPNGDLLATYTGWGDTPYGYGLVKMDKNSKVIWSYSGNTHHDIFVHPDTPLIYTLTQQFIERAGKNVQADYVTLLSSEGKLIKKISVLDAFDRSHFRDLLTNRQLQGVPWDPLHTNSIDVIDNKKAAVFPQFKPGYVLISIRNVNTIAVIDPEAERVVWAYSGIWSGQHAAHFTDHGTIILLDNNGGGSKVKPQSRIVEFNPSSLAMSVKYTATSFYTCAYGRVQPLENGHLFITETLGSRLFEIDKEGKIIWQYQINPFYQPRVPDFAPYGNNEQKYDPDFVCAQPNLATAIVYAERYTPDQLPFLTQAVQ